MQKQRSSEDPITARGRAAWEILQSATSSQSTLSRGSGLSALARRKKVQTERLRLWRDLGDALAVGKRASRTDRDYHEWLKVNGFEFVQKSARTDALWFAANATTLGEIPVGITSPTTLRSWVQTRNARQRATAIPSARSMGVTRSEVTPREPTVPVPMSEIADLLREAAASLLRGAELMQDAARLIDQGGMHE